VQPFKRLSQLHAVNQQAAGAAQRVLEILETQPTVRETPAAALLPRLSRGITFDHVSFRYPASPAPVLGDVTLAIARGELVAVVGPSGAGKTTLVNLLPRFYDPTGGRVLIDGVDLRQVTLASLRAQIGIVTQETFLFHESVRANIAFGAPGADEAGILAAARAANAHEFISRLPQGYDTVIGERGVKLSGGERQRLAIARAILRNPPILILDEATSQLDTASERLVQEALERLTEGRTAVVIAHRLSTVRRAHRIVVLEGGRIVEQGRHDELIQRGGLYQRLCALQFADVPSTTI
ncbi:MAG: ATP-binding cassette domain-containing protein, partial [Candidatus Omnitrophica bacterium]|nr:ATP-binding cassette domain-containing protein [Candidatus Omnitrophota bacterium]